MKIGLFTSWNGSSWSVAMKLACTNLSVKRLGVVLDLDLGFALDSGDG